MTDQKEKIRAIVNALRFPDYFRCYEGAEIIEEALKKEGFKVKRKVGGAIYDLEYFRKDFENFREEIISSLSEAARQEIIERMPFTPGFMKIFHSWCEVIDDPATPIVVDWHHYLVIGQGMYEVSNLLIIEEKNKLPHRYLNFGFQIGRVIVTSALPVYITLMRS